MLRWYFWCIVKELYACMLVSCCQFLCNKACHFSWFCTHVFVLDFLPEITLDLRRRENNREAFLWDAQQIISKWVTWLKLIHHKKMGQELGLIIDANQTTLMHMHDIYCLSSLSPAAHAICSVKSAYCREAASEERSKDLIYDCQREWQAGQRSINLVPCLWIIQHRIKEELTAGRGGRVQTSPLYTLCNSTLMQVPARKWRCIFHQVQQSLGTQFSFMHISCCILPVLLLCLILCLP